MRQDYSSLNKARKLNRKSNAAAARQDYPLSDRLQERSGRHVKKFVDRKRMIAALSESLPS